jgi:hypothetical protein
MANRGREPAGWDEPTESSPRRLLSLQHTGSEQQESGNQEHAQPYQETPPSPALQIIEVKPEMQCSPKGQHSKGQISSLRSLGISGHWVTDGAAVAGKLRRQSSRPGNQPGNHGGNDGHRFLFILSTLFVLFVLSVLFALPLLLAALVMIPNFFPD